MWRSGKKRCRPLQGRKLRGGVLDGEANNCLVVLYMIVFLFVYIVSMEIITEGKGKEKEE